MGDIKKAIHKPLSLLPIFGALVGGMGFFSAIWNVGFNALQGFAIGSALLGLGAKKKRQDGPQASVQFGVSKPGNWPDRNRAVPIVYGEVKINTGNLIACRTKTDLEQDRLVALCDGPVESITDIRINEKPYTDFTGCTADAYLGADDQALDARFTGYYKGGTRGLACIAATIKASDAMRGEPVISAVVKGRKVAVWNGSAWVTQWSDNPVWCSRDMMLNFLQFPLDYIDEDSFYAIAQIQDQALAGMYDRGRNVALDGACSGGNYPERGNDGSCTTANDAWYCTAEQNENLHLLGTHDLGSVKYTDFMRLWLYDGDDRWYYNYKVTASADGDAWTTLVDRTGSGANYQGCQDIEFTAGNYRYFRVYGSGNTINADFHVMEFEVFELVQAKRGSLNCVIDSAGDGFDALQKILDVFGGHLVESAGKIKLIAAHESLPTELVVTEEDMLEGTVSYTPHTRAELPNKVEVRFVDPWSGWLVNSVLAVNQQRVDRDGPITITADMQFCTSRSQAARRAAQELAAADKCEGSITWTGELNVLGLEVGDVVSITDGEAGWSGKLYIVTSIRKTAGGLHTVTGGEFVPGIYGNTPAASYQVSYRNLLPRPDAQPRHVTGLTLTEDKDQHADGTWLPKIVATFTRPSGGPEWDHADVELKVGVSGSYCVVGQSRDGTFEIKSLAAGVTYDVRVVSVSAVGVKAPVDTAPYAEITLAGKESAPSGVGGFNYSVGLGYIELFWNSATDINNDLSHYEVRDGESWAAGTVIFTDCSTTRKSFKPTKRTYHLWIKAFDRSGNESADATELNISIAAPTLAGAPALYASPPQDILIDITTPDNGLITHYDVHVSTSSGFTPDASTLKTSASKGLVGHSTVLFRGVAGTTYYIKVCPIDFLSYAVGDQFTYPSSQASLECRLVGGDDIIANSIASKHIATAGIDIGGGDEMATWLRLINAAAEIVGYFGKIGALDKYGVMIRDYLSVGPLDDPFFYVDNGVARLRGDLLVGASGTSEKILSSAENGTNLLPNGGFEQIKAVGWAGSDAAFIPCWTIDTGWYGDAGISDAGASSIAAFIQGRYSLAWQCSTSGHGRPVYSEYIPVIEGKKYPVSPYFRKYTETPAVTQWSQIIWYDRNKTYISQDDFEDTPTTTMARITHIVTAPANARYMRFQTYPSAIASGTQYTWVDAVQIECGEQATAYAEPAGVLGPAVPDGMAYDKKGLNIFSGGSQIVRLGNLAGLADGAGGTFSDPTTGAWFKVAQFRILNSSGETMLGVDGVTQKLFASTPILKAWLDSTLAALVQTSGNTTSDYPHDYHFALVASGTKTGITSSPYSWAHGVSGKAPMVLGFLRGKDTGESPAVYSRWHQVPSQQVGPVGDVNDSRFGYYNIVCDTTNIYLSAKFYRCYGTEGFYAEYGEFSSVNKQYFYLMDTSGNWTNVWDELEFKYFIFREGAT